MKTAIVTDTNSGIFQERGKQLGVYVVPMPVIIDDRTYYEGENLSPCRFCQFLAEGRNVSTSQPSPASLLEFWDAVLERYDELVYIPMSSGLSSSCEVARGLAQEYGGRVQVINNHRISLAQESSVLDAKALADAGCTAAEIKRELEASACDMLTFVGVETLEYLKRSGRVTVAGAALSTILNIRPLLKIEEGRLDAYDKVRGAVACQERLVSAIREGMDWFTRRGWTYRVAAADSYSRPEDRSRWLSLVSGQIGIKEIGYTPLTCSIGCHVGANAFGMAVSRRIA